MSGHIGATLITSTARARGRPSLSEAERIDRHLLEVGLRAFLAEGYAASMSAIARAAGVSKTTLYARFATKEALFRTIMRDQIERVAGLGAPSRISPGTKALGLALKEYADRLLVESFRGDLGAVRRLILSEAHRFPELGELGVGETRAVTGQMSAFIASCAQEDGIPCSRPSVIADIVMNILRGKLTELMLLGDQHEGERRAWIDDTFDAILAGRDRW